VPTDRSTARTDRAQAGGPGEKYVWLLGVLLAGALLLWTQFGGLTLGAGLECETAAQCERLAAEQKAILRTAIPYTVVATVGVGLAVFGYNLYTGAGPGAVSDCDDE
jgi:hypothetical protein